MITKTSLLATRALLCLVQGQQGIATPPRSIALRLGESQTYMAKVLRSLVKAGILRAEHGSKGGVLLNKRPDQITLLEVIEACQGTIIGNYCQDIADLKATCAFHQASVQLREAIVGVLSAWSLEQLARQPVRSRCLPRGTQCAIWMFPLLPAKASARAPKRKRERTN